MSNVQRHIKTRSLASPALWQLIDGLREMIATGAIGDDLLSRACLTIARARLVLRQRQAV